MLRVTMVIALLVILLGLCGCIEYRMPRDLPGNANVSGRLLNVPKGRLPDPDFGKVLPPERGAYIGVFQPDAPFTIEDLSEFTSVSKKKPALLMWFQPWGKQGRRDFFLSLMEEVREKGMVPLISWEPWDPPADPRALKHPEVAPAFRLRNIADGDFDDYVRFWARGARFYGGPMMIRPMHEMNGDWYPWGGTVNGNKPGDYIRAWRHIHDIFEEEGATNVTWVWSVNALSVPRTKANGYDAYYPGDEYVDWTAISGFNYGEEVSWSDWRDVDGIYGQAYANLKKHKKPILFVELASVERGGDKAAWIEDTFAKLRTKFPWTKGFVWFNAEESGRSFPVNSSKRAAVAFARAMADPYFVSRARVEQVGKGPVLVPGQEEADKN